MFVIDENRADLAAASALTALNIYMTWNPTYDNCFTAISEISESKSISIWHYLTSHKMPWSHNKQEPSSG